VILILPVSNPITPSHYRTSNLLLLLLLPPLLLLSLLAAVEVAVEAARVVVAHVQQRMVGASHLALARQAAVSE
jgi:hypothetical protein